MKEILMPWIEKGYISFAFEGPGGLKVERLSKDVGKNKSSFYHHFGDLEEFTSLLLEYHLDQSLIIAEKESNCNSMEDLIEVLVEHKIDLLFNRQLRIHRENREFQKCFLRVNEVTIPAIVPIWSHLIQLNSHSYLAELVLQLSLENFYLQITEETLNPEWLREYIGNFKRLVAHFKKTSSVPSLDGSV